MYCCSTSEPFQVGVQICQETALSPLAASFHVYSLTDGKLLGFRGENSALTLDRCTFCLALTMRYMFADLFFCCTYGCIHTYRMHTSGNTQGSKQHTTYPVGRICLAGFLDNEEGVTANTANTANTASIVNSGTVVVVQIIVLKYSANCAKRRVYGNNLLCLSNIDSAFQSQQFCCVLCVPPMWWRKPP